NSINSPVSPGPTVASNVSNDGYSIATSSSSSSNQYNDSSTPSQTTYDHNVDSTTNEDLIDFDAFDYSVETNNQPTSSAEENTVSGNPNNDMDTSFFDNSKTTFGNSKSEGSDEFAASKNLSFEKNETNFHENNTNSSTSRIPDTESLVLVTKPIKSSTNNKSKTRTSDDVVSDNHKKISEKILEIFSKHLKKDEGSNGLGMYFGYSCDLLVSSNKTGSPSLRSGIYLLIVNVNLGLVIHWPESDMFNESSDLKCFEWELRNDGDDDGNYIKESQEEKENFQLREGFKVQLPNYIQPDLKTIHYNEISMKPTVVESVSHQAFITQNIIKSSPIMRRCSANYSNLIIKLHSKSSLKDIPSRLKKTPWT
ncbi:8782_t:CDS:2, partial [Entrophospora sp. SA101]